MIALLRGVVAANQEDHAVVDVGGVGYMVHAGRAVLANLPDIGEEVQLFIETHVREDHIHLYGFLSAQDRMVFRLLGTVQGVGTRVALAICDALSADELVLAIAAGDKAALRRASGVGDKLASRIITELKSKDDILHATPAESSDSSKPAHAKNQVQADTLSALLNLGYDKSQAYKALQSVWQASGDSELTTEACIRLTLQNLARC